MNYLGVGFNDGALVILTPTFGDTNANFELSQSPIDTITFSNTGEYCAVTDLHFTITLFQNSKDWKVIFRSRPHFMDIKATLFHQNSVIFVSRDRHLTTVDLSSLVMTTRRIESVDRPTAAIVVTENNDEMVLCFNSGLKAKLYSSSQVCRRTSRGPPRSVQKAIAIGKDYVAFGSENHAGIARLELDGNCLRYGSVVAHGVDVKEIKFKGDFLLTLGSDDTINIWKIDFGFLEAQVCRYASDKVFLEMLETDNSIPQGKVFKTFEDYFYLLQLE
jgi:WD40 repeat protein